MKLCITRFAGALFTALALLVPSIASSSPVVVSGMTLTLDGVLKTVGLTADLITLFGLSDNAAGSDSITIRASGDETTYDLRIRGTDLDDTATHKLSGTLFGQASLASGGTAKVDLWSFNIDLQLKSVQDSLIVNEEIIANGDVRHEIGPHPGEAQQGPPLGFNLRVNADNEVNQVVQDDDPSEPMKHAAAHTDTLSTARLRASTDVFLFQDQIVDWDITLHAAHAVPEPGTWVLFGAGAALIGWRRWRPRHPGHAAG